MKRTKTKPRVSAVVLAAVAVVLASQFAYSQEDGYAMMIQESPAGSGKITPGIGVHEIGLNETITLTAIPKPGYQFVYWLGDVSDPTTNETTITVNGPKIVVAVFERTEYEQMLVSDAVRASIGGGGMVRSGIRARTGPAIRVSDHRRFKFPDFNIDDFLSKFPVPNEDEVIPEPASIMLLGGGALMVLRRRRRKGQK